ncbi:peptidoglycan DD-metalloendopeptidase family protein [Parabacteroides sp. OttesenSCG-928-G07]|nr:peptidoglycan DD-metalloendopeptidase family protein [Parabacteroides sp. OttesenSCG-928-G07]
MLLFPLMEEHVSSLMADRVEFNKDMGMGMKLVEVNERAALLSRESLMFPADELYNSNWENKWVNPFRNGGVVYPDSFLVDCSSFILPIDVDIKVTSRYGPRGRRMHRGIDLKVQKGDTIRAAFDGRVRIRAYERSGYGNYLVIRHSNGLETIYGHLSKFIVAEDQIVKAGEPIGLGGNTGRSTGSHLHFETRFLGVDINPEEFVDFTVGEPHQDQYVFRNLKLNGRNTNIFTASTNPSVYHVVKSGETLGKIARKYGTTVNELCRLNGLKTTSILRVGQSIRCSLGVDSQNSSPAQQVKTNTSTAKTTTVAASSVAVASLQENVSMQPQEEVEPVYHRIQSGDTLSEIAQKYGTTVTKLCALNGISRTTILRLGRNLRCM